MNVMKKEPNQYTLRSLVIWATFFSVLALTFGVFFSKNWCKGNEKSRNSGLVQRKKCKARKTLKNDALDANIGVDTAVNEPLKL